MVDGFMTNGFTYVTMMEVLYVELNPIGTRGGTTGTGNSVFQK